MKVDVTLHDVLVSARDVLQERGWVKGTMQDQRGCVSLCGAIDIASPEYFYRALDALYQHLPQDEPGEKWMGIEDFNDDLYTDERHIYDVLDRAIAWNAPLQPWRRS